MIENKDFIVELLNKYKSDIAVYQDVYGYLKVNFENGEIKLRTQITHYDKYTKDIPLILLYVDDNNDQKYVSFNTSDLPEIFSDILKDFNFVEPKMYYTLKVPQALGEVDLENKYNEGWELIGFSSYQNNSGFIYVFKNIKKR
jgi:hypothetical protein